jgi:hypothetical protein
MQYLHRKPEAHAKTKGLTTNTVQTKVVIQSRRDLNSQQREIQDIEAVDSFTFLATDLQ